MRSCMWKSRTTTGNGNRLARAGAQTGQRPPSWIAGFPVFGYDARIVDPLTGETLPAGEKGVLALGLPLPPGCMSTVWRNDNMFEQHYCGQFPGKALYSTFDYAVQDADGYFFIWAGPMT